MVLVCHWRGRRTAPRWSLWQGCFINISGGTCNTRKGLNKFTLCYCWRWEDGVAVKCDVAESPGGLIIGEENLDITEDGGAMVGVEAGNGESFHLLQMKSLSWLRDLALVLLMRCLNSNKLVGLWSPSSVSSVSSFF
jgi:hypothetical protein